MKLLILTQKVDKNDPILGFFHRWIEEFAKHCEKAIAICLQKGEYNLPGNVKVLSLGKESGVSKLKYILNFFKYIWQERKNYNVVFVHMNQEYVLLGGIFWRIWGKKIGLWYVHRQTNLKLWLAEKLVQVIFSSAPESFQIRSVKVKYVGHGIDRDIFKPSFPNGNGPIRFLYVGRITKIKNIDTIIRSINGKPLTLVGEPITKEDKKYKQELNNLAEETKAVLFWRGSVSNIKMPQIYASHSISMNSTPDGGMDKAVLESLAVGTPVFTSNKAFVGLLGEQAHFFIYKYGDVEDLAKKLNSWLQNNHKFEIMERLSTKVRTEYSVEVVISKITLNLNE